MDTNDEYSSSVDNLKHIQKMEHWHMTCWIHDLERSKSVRYRHVTLIEVFVHHR